MLHPAWHFTWFISDIRMMTFLHTSQISRVNNIQPWYIPFPILIQCLVPCPFLIIASWPAYRFLRRQVRWSNIPISKSFPQSVVAHTVKGFRLINEAEVDVFSGILLLISMIQRILTIWSLVPLPFLNPSWTPDNFWFMYYWSLAWRILSITLLVCEMNEIVQ